MAGSAPDRGGEPICARLLPAWCSTAEGADVILTILANAESVIESMQAALPGVGGDAIWLQMSTIGERATQRCMELAAEHRIAFIDAPVLGTRQPAQEGKLVDPRAPRNH